MNLSLIDAKVDDALYRTPVDSFLCPSAPSLSVAFCANLVLEDLLDNAGACTSPSSDQWAASSAVQNNGEI